MPKYEYHVVSKADRAPITMLNERLESMAAEGWEPIMMSGEATVNVMMRRLSPEAAAQQARPAAPAAQAQAGQPQAPRPQAPAQPQAPGQAQAPRPPAPAPRPPQSGDPQ